MPTVTSIVIATSSDEYSTGLSNITLTEAGTTTVYLNGTIDDANGDLDLNSVHTKFYRTNLTESCSDDLNNCYTNATSTCTIANADGTPEDTEANFSCPIELPYYADATGDGGRYDEDWTAYVTVIDNSAGEGVGTSTVEVNALLAVDIPTSIDYGSLGTGETTSTPMSITQHGNESVDLWVSGTEMSCDNGNDIPVGNQAWALDDLGYASSEALTGSSTDTDFGLGYRENGTGVVAEDLWWSILIPSGVLGSCTGTTTVVALSSDVVL